MLPVVRPRTPRTMTAIRFISEITMEITSKVVMAVTSFTEVKAEPLFTLLST
ncbi:MAG: hypothetical protein LUH18_02065 [Oscillospiraceae bacterium]|nr:hypothetical protein [Oscillospiraceae bacterium]